MNVQNIILDKFWLCTFLCKICRLLKSRCFEVSRLSKVPNEWSCLDIPRSKYHVQHTWWNFLALLFPWSDTWFRKLKQFQYSQWLAANFWKLSSTWNSITINQVFYADEILIESTTVFIFDHIYRYISYVTSKLQICLLIWFRRPSDPKWYHWWTRTIPKSKLSHWNFPLVL